MFPNAHVVLHPHTTHHVQVVYAAEVQVFSSDCGAACVREPLASSHVTNATIHAANRTLRTTFSNLQADTAYVVQVCACEGVRKGERERECVCV